MGPATRQSSAIGFIDAAGTDPSTDAVPSLLMQSLRKTTGVRLPWWQGTVARALTYPPPIRSCEDKAPRTMGGDVHGSWPVTQSSATWV